MVRTGLWAYWAWNNNFEPGLFPEARVAKEVLQDWLGMLQVPVRIHGCHLCEMAEEERENKLEVARYEVTVQEAAHHEATQHEATQHEATQHEATQHEATQHEATQHEATQHEADLFEAAQYEGNQYDAEGYWLSDRVV
ncbi:uncharacterized protein N7484_000273 [Penicillium longicatenatum]|uniref:uncharacterized protein n=1 Tax=Penicillium longicatenatum TaxID=1561947 RepID=UPI0025478AF3|nr:uncharacterized protein N7484_000273 [Penicillium longicatenatum]KAJ5660901.1 hypothetical protein N7484_000273 [Penicillium longicatenatum]